uniref:Uncharacterized protein n=1 Tax=Ciona intestinalis TaxID=7719 RepID=H2XT75_CIOIN
MRLKGKNLRTKTLSNARKRNINHRWVRELFQKKAKLMKELLKHC